MNMLKRFLWKNLGITVDRKFFITAGIFVANCVATILFAILFRIFQIQAFKILMILTGIPAGLLIINSLYTTLRWDFATKEERQEIEQEIAFKQLKRRVNDKDFQR